MTITLGIWQADHLAGVFAISCCLIAARVRAEHEAVVSDTSRTRGSCLEYEQITRQLS
jgi:hypothetical protein